MASLLPQARLRSRAFHTAEVPLPTRASTLKSRLSPPRNPTFPLVPSPLSSTRYSQCTLGFASRPAGRSASDCSSAKGFASAMPRTFLVIRFPDLRGRSRPRYSPAHLAAPVPLSSAAPPGGNSLFQLCRQLWKELCNLQRATPTPMPLPLPHRGPLSPE